MVLKNNGEYDSLNSSSSSTPSPPSSDESSCEEILPTEGDLLVVRRLLGSLPKDDDASQRENIFHTRCSVSGACNSPKIISISNLIN